MSSSVPSPRRRLIRYLIARDEILVGHDALAEIDLDPELLVDLVAANAAEIVVLRIEEETLEERRAFATVGGSPGRSWR